MNKIKKLFLMVVSLLATSNVLGYNLTINTISPSVGFVTASATSDIAYNTLITLTVTVGSGYYLEKIEYEEVMDLGGAESPRHRAPVFGTVHTINHNNNAEGFYAGAYTFYMPNNNVVVTAIFQPLTTFNESPLVTFELDESDYTGLARTLVVKYDGTPLTKGTDYNITNIAYNSVNQGSSYTVKNAGTYSFTVQGIGIYQGTITSSNFTINPVALEITPKNKSRQYHDANPTYSAGDFTYSGFVNNETYSVLTTQPSASIDANINSNVGYYTVTALGATAANYTITHLTGTLNITPRNVNNTTTQATATLSDNTYTFYTEQYYRHDCYAHQPSVTVIDPSDNDEVLTPSADFDVEYSVVEYGNAACENVGMYQAKIIFKENYTGDVIIRPYQIRKQLSLTNSHKWHTYYETDVNMKVQDGFEAYVVSSINTNVVGTTKKNYVKKDVPMLLYRTGDTQSFYPELVESNDGGLTGINQFSNTNGSFEGVEVPTDITTRAESGYDLWILINGEFVRTKSGYLPAHKCYLKLKSSLFSSPSISLSRGGDDDDGTTAIDGSSKMVDVRNDKYYDLNGRRVLYPRKGVYIMNGKKIIIK